MHTDKMKGRLMTNRAQGFAAHLNELEAGGDVEQFVASVFTEDAELVRPEAQQQLQGGSGARVFWEQYLAHFDTIRSDFVRLVDTDQLSVLEWRSQGRLRSGAAITYSGVSILDFDEGGRVRRFATYYDTSPFHAPPLPGQEA